MKTLLYVLGGLFILTKLRGQALTVGGTATLSSPFGTSPVGGAAGAIAPPIDPYAGIQNEPGGSGAASPNLVGIATNSLNVGSHFTAGQFQYPQYSPIRGGPLPFRPAPLSRVRPGLFTVAKTAV